MNKIFKNEFIKFNPLIKEILILLSFIFIAYVTFYPSLINLNYFWDDERFIFLNPDVINAPTWNSFWTQGDNFSKSWPLGFSIFWFLIKVFPTIGLILYKSLNIILHSFNGYIIYIILKKLKLAIPYFLVLFFIIHPLHVETVSWVFQLLVIISYTFYLTSINLLIRSCENENDNLTFVALVFFLFSIWTKSTAILGPFLFIGIFFFYSRPLKKYFLLIPFFILSLTVGIMNIKGTEFNFKQKNISWTLSQTYHDELSLIQSSLQKTENKENLKSYFDFNFTRPALGSDQDTFVFNGERVFRQASWHYIVKLFVPINLKFIYPEEKISISSSIIIVSLLFLLPILFYFETADKIFLFIMGLIITSLGPFLGFSKVTYFYWSFVADHYAYGFVLVLPFIIGLLLKHYYSKALKYGLISYLIILFLLNLNYGLKFNNPIEIYKEAIIDKPHPVIYSLLAQEYIFKLDAINAEKILNKGLAKFPNDILLKDSVVRLNALKASL